MTHRAPSVNRFVFALCDHRCRVSRVVCCASRHVPSDVTCQRVTTQAGFRCAGRRWSLVVRWSRLHVAYVTCVAYLVHVNVTPNVVDPIRPQRSFVSCGTRHGVMCGLLDCAVRCRGAWQLETWVCRRQENRRLTTPPLKRAEFGLLAPRYGNPENLGLIAA